MRDKPTSANGFTLVEILVAIAIIGVVMTIGLSIIVSILRSSTKTTLVNHVKQSGDLVLETMTRSVRNAVDACTTAGEKQIKFYTSRVTDCTTNPILRFTCTEGTSPPLSPSNGSITRTEEDGKGGIISGPTEVMSGVKIKEGSCKFSASNTIPRRVTIKFTLKQDVSIPDAADTTVDIPFETEVTLRNF